VSSSMGHEREYRLKSSSLSMERLDGEVIAIDFATGKYFSFLASAADLVWLLQNEIPRNMWHHIAQEAFDPSIDRVEFEAQVSTFLSELDALGLLESTDWLIGEPVQLPNDYPRGAWSVPVVMVENELVDLLVIDPIHDTGDHGWPEVK